MIRARDLLLRLIAPKETAYALWAGATPTSLTSGADGTAGTSATTASVTLTAGRLYIIYVTGRRGDSTNFAAPTSVVRGAQAFATVDATNGTNLTDTSSSSRRGAWMGYCIPASSTTGTIVITFADSYTNIQWSLVEITSGFDSSTPFLQTQKMADEDGTGTSSTLTFGSSMASDSLVIAGYNDASAGTLGPGAGYTELVEVAGDPATATAYNTAPDTTFDFSYTSGEEVGAIAVEIKAAAAAGTTVTPGTASLSLSTFAPKANLQINGASPAALSISAFAPQANLKINGASPTALVTAAFAPALQEVVTPSTLAHTLTLFAPTVSASGNQTVTPDTLAIALSTFAPQLRETLTPALVALTLAAFAPQLRETLTPATLALALSVFAPQLREQLTPGQAELVVTGFAPQLREVATPGAASLVTAAFAPALREVVTPGARALVMQGFAPSVGQPVQVVPSTLGLLIATFAPTVSGQEIVEILRTLGLATYVPSSPGVATRLLSFPATATYVENAPGTATNE